MSPYNPTPRRWFNAPTQETEKNLKYFLLIIPLDHVASHLIILRHLSTTNLRLSLEPRCKINEL
jgi:hypothetical protein